jgi:DNA-binding transcriptional regulator YiaG
MKNMTILEKARTDLNMTQVDVAIKVGVSLASYRMWEKGVTKPTDENNAKLKKVLELGD